ncbi:MAG TPA: transcriptional regulator [Actinomycetes bacterium]|nr:transcriptional regulator [Actinomycetes bacterium]
MTQHHPSAAGSQLAVLAVLQEPTRRALYLFVASQREPVSRDQAAAATGVGRSLAAFHLDRLAGEGLLDVEYRRLSGRRGPGAGRPAKLYRRSPREYRVTLPPRDHQLAAELLAEAVEAGAAAPLAAAAARRRGRGIGRAAAGAPARPGPDPATSRGVDADRDPDLRDGLAAAAGALAAHGFEPYRDGDGLRLRNCPFHPLAARHEQLVCGMNLELVAGVLEGLGVRGCAARLDPRPGECCVALAPQRPDV